MSEQVKQSVVSVINPTTGSVGAGVLVDDRHIVTAAHVVARALGLPDDSPGLEGRAVTVRFPLVAPERALTTRIVLWLPPKGSGGGDIAGLRLEAPAPAGARPAQLVESPDLWGHGFRAYGFPSGFEQGVWASGRLLDQVGNGWIQIEDVKPAGQLIRGGFSGGPVWDEVLNGLVAIIVAVDRREESRTAFAIPTQMLREAWAHLRGLTRARSVSRLGRRDWLTAHGFLDDPFSASAFQAETDPAFEHAGLPAFVDPPNYEEIRGELASPGYLYIFAASGAGKSSLRRRITYDLANNVRLDLAREVPKVLVVEYVDHSYSLNSVDLSAHVTRLTRLVEARLTARGHNLRSQAPDTALPRERLLDLLHTCQSAGLDGLYLLVDNVDAQSDEQPAVAFGRIQSLAAHHPVLNIPGLVFKFILPSAMLDLARQSLPLTRFPVYELGWDRVRLRDALRQRLIAFRDPQEAVFNLAELFDPSMAARAEELFVDFGLRRGSPRHMWLLGYYVLVRYFEQSRTADDRIDEATYLSARMTVERLSAAAAQPAPARPANAQRAEARMEDEQKQAIRDALGDNDIPKALTLLQTIAESTAVLLRREYRHLEDKLRQGTLTDEQYTSNVNRIVKRVLDSLAGI